MDGETAQEGEAQQVGFHQRILAYDLCLPGLEATWPGDFRVGENRAARRTGDSPTVLHNQRDLLNQFPAHRKPRRPASDLVWICIHWE